MREIFKNFISIFRRNKISGLLNILGFTFAFIGFVLILIQLKYELGFDTYYPDKDNIYRLSYRVSYEENGEQKSGRTLLFIRNDLDAIIEHAPQIDKGTLIYPWIGDSKYKQNYFQYDFNGERRGDKEVIVTCYPDIVDIFGFEMIEGSKDALRNPENVIIPKSLAKRLFGNRSAIGENLYYNEYLRTKSKDTRQHNIVLTVGGVYKDMPDNVQIGNYIYTSINDTYAKSKEDASSNHLFFVTLTENADIEQLENFFITHPDLMAYGEEEGIQVKLVVDKITDVYFSGIGDKTGDSRTSLLLTIIAVLVIAIAGINFTNFSMALAPRRLRSINIQRVLGSNNFSLRLGLTLEAVALSVVSLIIAFFVVYLIIENHWMPFINTGISRAAYIQVILISFAVAILLGVIAGIRPAYYMTSFNTIAALKGRVVFTSSGFKLRTLLVGFQFLIAIVLISMTLLIYKQHRYISRFNLGFNIEQIAIAELNADIAYFNKNKLIDNLKKHPNIVDVAFSASRIGGDNSYSHYGGMLLNGDATKTSGYNLLAVSWNFLDLMEIRTIEGRTFTEADDNTNETCLIINETLQKTSGAKVGDSFFTHGV